LDCLEESGVKNETAAKILAPLLFGTIDNSFSKGPAKALSGPISRGDTQVVEKQLNALSEIFPDYEQAYRVLGLLALELSKEKGTVTSDQIDAIIQILKEK